MIQERPTLEDGIPTHLTMSNFDHAIDEGLDEALRAQPGRAFGAHTAWNFYGVVWFSDGLFHERVLIYGNERETLSATTLRELMTVVNEKYGND